MTNSFDWMQKFSYLVDLYPERALRQFSVVLTEWENRGWLTDRVFSFMVQLLELSSQAGKVTAEQALADLEESMEKESLKRGPSEEKKFIATQNTRKQRLADLE